MVFGGIELTELTPNTKLSEHPFHAKGTRLVRNNGNYALTNRFITHNRIK